MKDFREPWNADGLEWMRFIQIPPRIQFRAMCQAGVTKLQYALTLGAGLLILKVTVEVVLGYRNDLPADFNSDFLRGRDAGCRWQLPSRCELLESKSQGESIMRHETILRWTLGAVLLFGIDEKSAADAAEDESWRKQATPGEIQLVDTVKALYEAYREVQKAKNRIDNPVKEREYFKTQDPGREFIPKLMEIEKKNRGTQLGLLACRKLVHLGGGEPDSPNNAGQRQVLEQLHHYTHDPLCVEFIRYLSNGWPEPTVADALKKQIRNQQTHPIARDACRYYLAEFYLNMAVGRDYRERRIKELDAGDTPPRSDSEREDLSKSLARYPDWEIIRKHEADAVALLRQLVAEGTDHRLPMITNVDPDWILIRLDDKPNTNPRFAEMADGLLFKQQYLRIGKPAPALKLKLLNGEDWSLEAQRGRVVIIQFSFKGCGPCEEMYPDLREMVASYRDDLTVLSIMADREKQDTVEASESGKITWDICWDGDRGPIATRWGVKGHPTIYVADKYGRMAGYGLRGEQLKKKVADLINVK